MKSFIKIQIPPPVIFENEGLDSFIDSSWEECVLPEYEKICISVYEILNKNDEIFNSWKKKSDNILNSELEKSKANGFLPLVIVLETP